jgi:hypothetical protein
MLKEIENVRQVPGEGPRRWFLDEDMDLILWYDDEKKLEGFQLYYDKRSVQRSITWKISRVAETQKSIYLMDGPFNKNRVARMFEKACPEMDDKIAKFVRDRLEAYKTTETQ